MKVKIFDKRLWKEFSCVVSVLCGVVSFSVIFIDVPAELRLGVGGAILVLLCAIFIIMLVRANTLKEKVLKINRIKFVLKFGDLFSENGLKVIAFNEYFDTQVNDKLVSPNTINGKFLNRKVSNISQLDSQIENDMECMKNIIETNDTRPEGKKDKYKLGTAVRYNDYILVAFSKFNEHNQAYLTVADYFGCLANCWSEINRVYNGENIALPLLGTGITRLMDGNQIKYQNALEIILQTFAYSNLSFTHDCTITVVLPESLKEDINLYDVGGKLYVI